jgi:hypothetical protein
MIDVRVFIPLTILVYNQLDVSIVNPRPWMLDQDILSIPPKVLVSITRVYGQMQHSLVPPHVS